MDRRHSVSHSVSLRRRDRIALPAVPAFRLRRIPSFIPPPSLTSKHPDSESRPATLCLLIKHCIC